MHARHSSNTLAPMAGGYPISEEVADQAAHWLTVWMSGEMTPEDQQRWQAWCQAHPDHARAWQHIQAITGRFRTISPQAGYQALSNFAEPVASSRRKAIRVAGVLAAVGMTGLLTARSDAWKVQMADLRTVKGQRRHMTLSDGTQLALNTATAVNQHFDAQIRRLYLLQGEVQIHTGKQAGDSRPFFVETAHGSIRALGTRFIVRHLGNGRTHVSVQESAVEVRPINGTQVVRLHAGEQVSFSHDAVEPVGVSSTNDEAWLRGQIIAEDTRLDDFLAELARHRAGILRCDPAVAKLRLSGVYPLADTDRILSTLHNVLPVQVMARTRYWVTVGPSSFE